MMEITNKQKFPVQLIVRSKKSPRSFVTLNVPGIGSGKNVCYLEDERHTEYIDRVEKEMHLISVKTVPDKAR